MIKKLAVFVFALTAYSVTYAQYNTGDSGLNASLVIIDDGAKADYSAFKVEMTTTYKVTEVKITSWSVEFGMKAGDIYLVLEIGKLTQKPADEVVKVYQANKKKGWGAIAKELGIKPGSPEFHALKGDADAKAKKSKEKQKAGKAKPKK